MLIAGSHKDRQVTKVIRCKANSLFNLPGGRKDLRLHVLSAGFDPKFVLPFGPWS